MKRQEIEETRTRRCEKQERMKKQAQEEIRAKKKYNK